MSEHFYTFYEKRGNSILYSYIRDGKQYSNKIKAFKPHTYVETKEDTGYTSLYGTPVRRIDHDDIKAADVWRENYGSVSGMNIHGNRDVSNQFIIDMFKGQMPEYRVNQIRGAVLDIEVFSELGFPEPAVAEHPVTAITLYDTVTGKYNVFCYADRDFEYDPLHKDIGGLDVEVFRCSGEEGLMRTFVSFFASRQYQYISGWNSETFDIPYIVNRTVNLLGKDVANELSPFGVIKRREVRGTFGKTMEKVTIVGVQGLDYMALYKKHTFTPRDSYKLDHIGNVEVGTRKLTFEETSNLVDLYKQNYQGYICYNIMDVHIIVKLDAKLQLFALTFTLAYFTLSNYEDTLGTVKFWEKLIARYLYNDNVIPPYHRPHNEKSEKFEGAYVRQPVVGRHKWIFSVDLNSLYPHLIQQYNIGPETHIPHCDLPGDLQVLVARNLTVDELVTGTVDLRVLKKYNMSMSASCEFFDNSKMSYLSSIMRDLYKQRKVHKKNMLVHEQELVDLKQGDYTEDQVRELEALISALDNLQMAMKIAMNSGYGAIGNDSFLYYKLENAKSITLSGQLINKWTCTRVNDLLNRLFKTTDQNYWVYSDTDSGYFTVEPYVNTLDPGLTTDEITDKVNALCEKIILPKINQFCEDMGEYLNVYEQRMFWGREIIAPSAIWVAKKRYTAMVMDSEGVRYAKPKMKIMGLEAVKSSTPAWSRDNLKKGYEVCMTQEEDSIHTFVTEARKQFDYLGSDEISIPSGVNNIAKYEDPTDLYRKGTPRHVKGSIIHNWMIDRLGLTNIAKITDGDKIRTLALRKPNMINQEVIAFDGHLPAEFGLDKYVDREIAWEKGFRQPLQNFLDALQWSTEKTLTLDDLFG